MATVTAASAPISVQDPGIFLCFPLDCIKNYTDVVVVIGEKQRSSSSAQDVHIRLSTVFVLTCVGLMFFGLFSFAFPFVFLCFFFSIECFFMRGLRSGIGYSSSY